MSYVIILKPGCTCALEFSHNLLISSIFLSSLTHVHFVICSIISLSARKAEQRVLEFETSRNLELWQNWSLVVWILSLFHHDTTLWAPRWMPWVFLSTVQGFLSCHLRLALGHGIQAGHQAGMAPSAPKRLEAFTLSEQTSGQMATTVNRHGTNSNNNEQVSLYDVMETLFMCTPVSDTTAVICKTTTVPMPACKPESSK